MNTVVVVVLVVLLLVPALRLWLTANRLDRLHVRTEAAWSALELALARRIVATRAVAAVGGLDHPQSDELRGLADVADHADRAHRADAENDLSRALSIIPAASEPELAAELADASERVVLARRFYNDAVRDTRALRAVLFTRVFGLAGRAAMPDYFEIAEYPNRQVQVQVQVPISRTAARVVLIDHADRLLLLSGTDPQVGSRWWITPGGGVEVGETLRDAARRELAEETGLLLGADDLIGPIWRRVARFTFTGIDYEQTESYFAARVPRSAAAPAGLEAPRTFEQHVDAGADGAPSGSTMVADPLVEPQPLRPASQGPDPTVMDPAVVNTAFMDPAFMDPAVMDTAAVDASGHTFLERQTLTGHRWWTAQSLADTEEMIYPVELARRFPEVLGVVESGVVPVPVPDID